MFVDSPRGAAEPCGEMRRVRYGRSARFTRCAAVLCGLAAFAVPAARAEVPAGSIYITSLPSGADIFVDGTYVGRSPALVAGLGRGRHAVTLTKTGWVVAEVDVAVPAGSIAMSSTRLSPGPRAYAGDAAGSVTVRGVPAGASLMLDGQPFLPSPQPFALPAGPHHISLLTVHGRTTRPIDVLPDTTTQIVLQEPKAAQAHTSIIAPAEDYLPTDAFTVTGKKIVVRYGGHSVVGHIADATLRIDGAPAVFDAAPDLIGGRLYLPLALLEKLAGDTAK